MARSNRRCLWCGRGHWRGRRTLGASSINRRGRCRVNSDSLRRDALDHNFLCVHLIYVSAACHSAQYGYVRARRQCVRGDTLAAPSVPGSDQADSNRPDDHQGTHQDHYNSLPSQSVSDLLAGLPGNQESLFVFVFLDDVLCRRSSRS